LRVAQPLPPTQLLIDGGNHHHIANFFFFFVNSPSPRQPWFLPPATPWTTTSYPVTPSTPNQAANNNIT
jgi:hypothetical protein